MQMQLYTLTKNPIHKRCRNTEWEKAKFHRLLVTQNCNWERRTALFEKKKKSSKTCSSAGLQELVLTILKNGWKELEQWNWFVFCTI